MREYTAKNRLRALVHVNCEAAPYCNLPGSSPYNCTVTVKLGTGKLRSNTIPYIIREHTEVQYQ